MTANSPKSSSSQPFYSSEPYISLPRGAAHDAYPLSTKAVAAQLGMSEVWLANLRSKGKGPRYVRVGTRVFYSPEDVAQWRRATDLEAPAVRVVLPELRDADLTVSCEWYSAPPAMNYEPAPPRDRIIKVDLPSELATVANQGVGYLVLAPEPAEPGEEISP